MKSCDSFFLPLNKSAFWLFVLRHLVSLLPNIFKIICLSRRVWIYQREVIRIRKSMKDRQHHGQKKKYKRTNNDLQIKDQETRTTLKTGGELRCSGFWAYLPDKGYSCLIKIKGYSRNTLFALNLISTSLFKYSTIKECITIWHHQETIAENQSIEEKH